MTDEYSVFLPEYTAGAEGGLSSEERRQLSLQNLAMSKSKKKKKKRQSSRTGERKLTEAERRAQEQARIREEREKRRALSEANRREAGIGVQTASPELTPDPEQIPPEAEQKKTAVEDFPPDIEDINIDIPTETAAERKQKEASSAAKEKKKKAKKNSKTSVRRTAHAGRYTKTAVSAAYPNRITTGGAVTLGILTCVLIGTVIYGRVQTNEIYTEIAALQAEYDDLVAKNVSMKSEMEGKMTVKNIEEYAENVLGLRPLNQSQIEYIQLQTEDEVLISEPESNFFVTINDYLVSFWEFLRGR